MPGLATGVPEWLLSSPTAGLQSYNSALRADILNDSPLHSVSPVPTFIVNGCFTLISTESSPLQPKIVSPCRRYTLSESGEASVVAQLAQESDAAGLQV